MPFTPAHAAPALPLLRLRLVPSALVVGTMAPDFEYFLRLAPGGGFGHPASGAFLLSLPMALAVLWIFHALVKAPLVHLFPDAIRLRIAGRIGPFRFGGPGRFVLIAVSALVGIATHIVWDSFTHSYTWPVHYLPWLTQRVTVPLLGSIEHCTILQHLSTMLGLLAVVAWVVHWYRNTPPAGIDRAPAISASRRYMVLGCIGSAAILGGIIRALVVLDTPGLRHKWETVIADGTVTGIALAWWVLVLYAVISARPRLRVAV